MGLMTATVYCVLVAVTIIGISNGDAENAVATIYGTVDTNENNNCIWQNTDPITDTSIFPFGNFAAVNSIFFGDALACGECYELSCVSKISAWGSCDCIDDQTVTVMVIDYGHDPWGVDEPVFDLPQSVASNIISGANCVATTYNIQYKQVCCNHQQNIAIFNFEGITDHWLSFVVANVAGWASITDLWMREPGRNDYYECNRDTNGMNGNWICDPSNDPPYQLPIDIKIRDSSGTELESLGVITSFTANQEFDFGTNFELVSPCGPKKPKNPSNKSKNPSNKSKNKPKNEPKDEPEEDASATPSENNNFDSGSSTAKNNFDIGNDNSDSSSYIVENSEQSETNTNERTSGNEGGNIDDSDDEASEDNVFAALSGTHDKKLSNKNENNDVVMMKLINLYGMVICGIIVFIIFGYCFCIYKKENGQASFENTMAEMNQTV